MVKPISLRIRAHEATARARQLLREFDEKKNLQRRVRWQAMKAVVAIREMRAAAAPKLRTLSSSDSKRNGMHGLMHASRNFSGSSRSQRHREKSSFM
ncbi:MAG: hypothetical protein ACM3Z4_18055 [Hyphomicrobiales bacterium]|jgi:hypothetical protein